MSTIDSFCCSRILHTKLISASSRPYRLSTLGLYLFGSFGRMYIGSKVILKVGVPPGERWTVLGNVLCSPQHAQIVGFSVHFIVGAYNVEATLIQFLNQKVNHLRWHPRTLMW